MTEKELRNAALLIMLMLMSKRPGSGDPRGMADDAWERARAFMEAEERR